MTRKALVRLALAGVLGVTLGLVALVASPTVVASVAAGSLLGRVVEGLLDRVESRISGN